MTARRTELTGDLTGNCHGPICVTCSDRAVEASVLEVLGDDIARVRTDHGDEIVSVALVTARSGDTVLVHAGEALTVVRAP